MPTYELFSGTEVLGRMALERMLDGLSTRRYRAGWEPVGARTAQAAICTSRSAVSRRFVAATETALAELLAADLSTMDLVALMADGVHFGEHCCIVALGIDIDGTKHPSAAEDAAMTRSLGTPGWQRLRRPSERRGLLASWVGWGPLEGRDGGGRL